MTTVIAFIICNNHLYHKFIVMNTKPQPREKLHLAIQRHYRKAKTLGKTATETWGEEEIHRFRIEVKKLRACLHLAGCTQTGIKASLPGRLEVFNRMIGIVRHLQLQRKGLENAAVRLRIDLPDTCSAALEGRIETAQAVIGQYLTLNSPLGKPRAEWHAPFYGRPIGRGVEAFVREKAEILSIGQELPDEDGLHILRKAIKDILYAWPCFPGVHAISTLPKKWRTREALKSCSDKLGQFHDTCMQLELLQDNYFLMSADSQTGCFLDEVRQLWRKDKEEKLEELRHLLLPVCGVNENPLAPSLLNGESYELHVD
jgi:CHAD domain-containing protein